MRNWLLWLIGREEMVELERWRVEWNEHRRWMAEFELARATLDHMRGCVDGQPMNSMQNLRDSFRNDTQPPAVGVDVTDETVERVEQAIGMGHEAWDMVDPKELIRATAAALRTGGGA